MSIAEQDPNAAKVARETAATEKPRRWLGKSLNRVEDPRFLRGQGRYLDDIKLPGMLVQGFVQGGLRRLRGRPDGGAGVVAQAT